MCELRSPLIKTTLTTNNKSVVKLKILAPNGFVIRWKVRRTCTTIFQCILLCVNPLSFPEFTAVAVMLKLIGVWDTNVFPLPEQGQRSDSLQQPGTGRNPAPCANRMF